MCVAGGVFEPVKCEGVCLLQAKIPCKYVYFLGGAFRFPYKFVYFFVITVSGWACAVWLGWVCGLCWVLSWGARVVVVIVGLVRGSAGARAWVQWQQCVQ